MLCLRPVLERMQLGQEDGRNHRQHSSRAFLHLNMHFIACLISPLFCQFLMLSFSSAKGHLGFWHIQRLSVKATPLATGVHATLSFYQNCKGNDLVSVFFTQSSMFSHSRSANGIPVDPRPHFSIWRRPIESCN